MNNITQSKILELISEIDCRIQHGAKSNGHLEYVLLKLKSIYCVSVEGMPDARTPWEINSNTGACKSIKGYCSACQHFDDVGEYCDKCDDNRSEWKPINVS